MTRTQTGNTPHPAPNRFAAAGLLASLEASLEASAVLSPRDSAPPPRASTGGASLAAQATLPTEAEL